MKFKKNIKPVWENIHKVQDKLQKKLKKRDKSYIDSVKMVAGELLENSVKYYMNNNIKKPIKFSYSDTNEIKIGVENQIINEVDLYPLTQFIDRIINSKNPYDLFLSRLQEILDNRIKGESRLGLLRVASDGGYVLGYEYNDNKINIFAKKSINEEEIIMKSLEYEDLRIDIMEIDSYVKVMWIGKCRTLNPENVLDTYLAELAEYLVGKKAIITFDKLEAMNSSTVPPLLTFIKNLEENGVDSRFLYNDKEDWQRASFKPLSVIAGRYIHVKIEASSFNDD
ncbi:MAG: hypothetical protein JXR64_06375 [Spirochaetales bacterium]|nr:hypothetical protein [Spirochaetales bacterium]